MAGPTSRRRPLGIALVALASLLAYLAILAIWVDRQALNTDNWTQASSQMLENPTVRNRVAEYLVEQLYANVDVQAEIRAALPERAQLLAELEARTGIGGRVATRLPADAAQVTVLRSDQLELAQDAFTVLDALPIV